MESFAWNEPWPGLPLCLSQGCHFLAVFHVWTRRIYFSSFSPLPTYLPILVPRISLAISLIYLDFTCLLILAHTYPVPTSYIYVTLYVCQRHGSFYCHKLCSESLKIKCPKKHNWLYILRIFFQKVCNYFKTCMP